MAAKYGIDFGTITIKIYKKNTGLIFDAKNIIAIADGKKVIATGDEAYEMYGKAPSNIEVTFPVKSGVIADINNMRSLLDAILEKLTKDHGRITGADFIITAPTDITEVEKKAFADLINSSSAKPKSVRIVERPIAAGLGAGLNITEANGVMMVDIGGDTTEISVLSLGGIVLSRLIPVGGNAFDEDIITSVKKKFNLVIGSKTAEKIKKELAMAVNPDPEATIKVFGRDVVTGLPTEKEIDAVFVHESIEEHLRQILDAVRIVLERTPPEISSDIIDSGVYICGGSALIKKLDELLNNETELKINICDDPVNTIARGLGKIIEDSSFDTLAYELSQPRYKDI